MKHIKQFISKLLSSDTNISSKRFIALVGFFSLLIALFIGSFTDLSKAPSDSLVQAIELIVMFALGGNVAEKFTKYKDQI